MLKNGIKIDDFKCITLDGETSLKEIIKGQKCILVFLRFYGCRVTQYDLREFSIYNNEFLKKGYKLIIVLQSTIDIINAAYKERKFPFEIISDPEERLYTLFEVGSAVNRESLSTESDKLKIKKADELGLKKGILEGNPLQLPAEFIFDEELNLKYSYYGKTSGDIISPEELLKKLD